MVGFLFSGCFSSTKPSNFSNFKVSKAFFFILPIFLVALGSEISGLPAFKGAEGFGSDTPGGRGGSIIHVTNLKASGSGSLANAIDQTGKRLIIFDVSGEIDFGETVLNIKNGQVTIAGETSPGGITLRHVKLGIQGQHIIVRYLRLRGVPYFTSNGDNINIENGAANIILDHISVSESCDESISMVYSANNVTVSWSAIEQPAAQCHHQKEQWHNYGMLLSNAGKQITVHHTIFAHITKRAPRVTGGTTVEFINNVIYNWGIPNKEKYGSDISNGNAHIIGTYYKSGPNTLEGEKIRPFRTADDVYVNDNWWEDALNGPHPQSTMCVDFNNVNETANCHTDGPVFTESGIVAEPVLAAYTSVLDKAGTLPKDGTSKRIAQEIKNGTGTWYEYKSSGMGDNNILPTLSKPADADNDGMPDWWEEANGLNKNSAADAGTIGSDGYMNIEKYMHAISDDLMNGNLNPWGAPLSAKFSGAGNNGGLDLSIFPNPFYGSITVRVTAPGSLVRIFNLLGEEVFSQKVTKGHSLVWNGKSGSGLSLPGGIYVLKAYSPKGIATQKLLKISGI